MKYSGKRSRLRIVYWMLWLGMIVLMAGLSLAEQNHKGKLLYAITAVLLAACMVSVWIAGKFRPELPRAEAAMKALEAAACGLEASEAFQNSMDAAQKTGFQWFHLGDRRRIIDRILWLLVGNGLVLWGIRLTIDPGKKSMTADWFLLLVLCVLSKFLLDKYRSVKYLEILTKKLRPLSGAWAFLAEAAWGGGLQLYSGIWLYNSAVCLNRAGLWEQALSLTEGIRKRNSSADLRLMQSLVRHSCFLALGKEREAKVEWEIQKRLFYEKPRLERKFKMQILRQEICKLELKNRTEQMEALTELYLERCTNDYYRLPVLLNKAHLYQSTGRQEQAMELYGELLKFSDENSETRKAAAYGSCSYYEPKGFFRERRTIRILRLLLFMESVLIFLLAASQTYETGAEMTGQRNIKESIMAEEERHSEQENTSQSLKEEECQAEEYDYKEYVLELPQEWENKVIVREIPNGGKMYCQKSSFEKMGDGMIFSIQIYVNGDYVNLPDYQIWGYDEEKVYVMTRPTDVSFYGGDEKIRQEYDRLQSQVEQIRDTFRILSDTASYDGDQFVFPNSSYCFINEGDLLNLSAEELRIAKNEIYARHGRKFKDSQLQRYFNSCSWYEGGVEPEDFSEHVLGIYEKKNIELISQRQAELE